tara:strand:+ start:5823 stop:6311 length:489 start_codon:yes stop_codon:yes gene_type:complete
MKKDKQYYESLDKRSKQYKTYKASLKVEQSKEEMKEVSLKSEGLGDTIEKITTATGIKALVEMFTPEGGDCNCGKRKETLNKMFPYNKPNCMNEEQYEAWGEAKEDMDRTGEISINNQDLIVVLIREVHNMAISAKGCRTCSASIWKKYIDMINKVYETYEK